MFSDLISGIVWVTSVSYLHWSMVSKVTVNQLQLSKITQAIPDILASNASAQSSQSFWSGQYGRHFIVLGHQYGRCDVTCRRACNCSRTLRGIVREGNFERRRRCVYVVCRALDRGQTRGNCEKQEKCFKRKVAIFTVQKGHFTSDPVHLLTFLELYLKRSEYLKVGKIRTR